MSPTPLLSTRSPAKEVLPEIEATEAVLKESIINNKNPREVALALA